MCVQKSKCEGDTFIYSLALSIKRTSSNEHLIPRFWYLNSFSPLKGVLVEMTDSRSGGNVTKGHRSWFEWGSNLGKSEQQNKE